MCSKHISLSPRALWACIIKGTSLGTPDDFSVFFVPHCSSAGHITAINHQAHHLKTIDGNGKDAVEIKRVTSTKLLPNEPSLLLKLLSFFHCRIQSFLNDCSLTTAFGTIDFTVHSFDVTLCNVLDGKFIIDLPIAIQSCLLKFTLLIPKPRILPVGTNITPHQRNNSMMKKIPPGHSPHVATLK
jgi:hypothetical protein